MAENQVDIVVNGKDNATPTMEKVAGAGKGLGGLMGDLGKGMAVFGLATAGFGQLSGALEGFLGKASEVGAEVFKLKSEIGGTAEDASRLRFAFEETGVPLAKGELGLKKFSVALSGVGGVVDGITVPAGKAMNKMLGEMGISVDDASGKQRSMIDILGDTAQKFSTMPDGIEKTTLASKLFGKAGLDMIPMLNKGRDGLAELEKESDKLGLTLNQKTLDSLKKQKMAMREMGAAVDGVKLQIGVALTPVITFLAEKLAMAAAFITSQVIPVIKDLAGWIGDRLAPVFAAISKDVENFAAVIGGALTGDITGAATAFNKLPEPLQNLALTLADVKVKAEAMIGVFMRDVLPVLQDMASKLADVLVPALQAFGDWLTGNMDIVAAFGAGVIGGIIVPAFIAWAIAAGAAAVATIAAALPVIALGVALGLLGVAIFEIIKHHDAIKDKILEVWGAVSTFMNDKLGFIVDIVRADFDSMKVIVETAINVVKDIIAIVMDIIHGDWGKLWNDVKQLLSDVWDSIKALIAIRIEEVKNLLGDAWEAIRALVPIAWEAIRAAVADGMAAIWDAVKYIGAAVIGWFVDLPGAAVGALAGLASMMYSVGVDIVQAIMDGIDSIIGSLWSKVSDIASSIADKLNPKNWIGSPKGMQNWLPYYFEKGLVGLQASINRANIDTSAISGAFAGGFASNAGGGGSSGGSSSAVGQGSNPGVEVHFNGPVTIQAQDQAAAEQSTQDVGWGIVQGMRSRGVWA